MESLPHSKFDLFSKRNGKQYRRNICRRCKKIRDRYNLSRLDYNAMINKQANKCAICSTEFSITVKACVDHCHQTGDVRGLLCRNCNLALGMINDNLQRLQSMILYLDQNQRRSVPHG